MDSLPGLDFLAAVAIIAALVAYYEPKTDEEGDCRAEY